MLGKIFKRLIFNFLFAYIEERNLISAHQFGFRAKATLCKSTAFQSFIYMQLLIHTLLLKLVVYFYICPRLLSNGFTFKLKSISISISIGIIIIRTLLKKLISEICFIWTDLRVANSKSRCTTLNYFGSFFLFNLS